MNKTTRQCVVTDDACLIATLSAPMHPRDWVMAQTALSAATRDALSVLVSAYGGLQQRNGQFYIVESRVAPHLRTKFRTFKNYLTKLRKLGLLEIIVRGPNQFGPRTTWRMRLDVVRQSRQLALALQDAAQSQNTTTDDAFDTANPSAGETHGTVEVAMPDDAPVQDAYLTVVPEQVYYSEDATRMIVEHFSAGDSNSDQMVAMARVLGMQGSALMSMYRTANEKRRTEGIDPVSRVEFLAEQGVVIEDDSLVSAVFGEIEKWPDPELQASVSSPERLKPPPAAQEEIVSAEVLPEPESDSLDDPVALVSMIEATLDEMGENRLQRWHRRSLSGAEELWRSANDGQPVPESIVTAAVRRIDLRPSKPENFAAYLSGTVVSMIKQRDDGRQVSSDKLKDYLRRRGQRESRY